MVAKEHVDYGIDAPDNFRRFAILGLVSLAASIVIYATGFGIFSIVFGIVGAWWIFCAALTIVTSKFGKFRIRDALISRIAWRGDERVLDVGCGHGLLLVAAAKKLTTGRAVGIDIWSHDQGDTRPKNTARNAMIEGVADRVEIRDCDARQLAFPDEYFDVVISSLALHNIPVHERGQAIGEIMRVLKPGGQVAIYDIKQISRYQQIFLASGMEQVRLSGRSFWYLLPTFILTAIKPGRPHME